jgi:two-component system response regulator DesR
VLIVDDMAQVRQELRTVLPLAAEAAGVTIEIAGEAGDGQEAVRLAAALQPEAILLDLEMPGMDGYTAANEIKALQPSIRLLALTVHSYPAAREKARRAGVDEFIVKGAPVETLVRALVFDHEDMSM